MDKKLIKFELKGAELDLFEDLQEKKKIEKPKTLFILLMVAELERINK
jgi:hypothetical protein